MLWTPQKGRVRIQHNMADIQSTATAGTSATTGASATTYGSPAEIFSSLNFDVYGIYLSVSQYSAAANTLQAMMNLLVGGSGSEDPIIPDLIVGYNARGAVHYGTGQRYFFPIYIPAGTRVAWQVAGGVVSTAMRIIAIAIGGDGSPPWRVGSKVTSYGVGTVPQGTAITPGASGAEGSWTQIVASTTSDHFAIMPGFQPNGDTTINNRGYALEIGRGASTAEDPIHTVDYWYGTTNAEEVIGPTPCLPAFVDIPSGSRLVMRVSNSGTNDGGYGACLYGIS